MDVSAVKKRLEDLAAERAEFEIRALQLDRDAVLAPYVEHGGEALQSRLVAEAKDLRAQARNARIEYLDLIEQLLLDQEVKLNGGTDDGD